MAHRPHVTGGYNEESVLALTRSPEERQANARLIAAAPALLVALDAIMRILPNNFSDTVAARQARAILDKVQP